MLSDLCEPTELAADQKVRLEEAFRVAASAEEREMFSYFLAKLDFDRYAQIQRTHLAAGATWQKFLDLPRLLSGHFRRAVKQGLAGATARQILDVGCGGGHYGAVCGYMHHHVVGMDVPGDSLIAELNQFFGTNFIASAVKPMERLRVEGKFDLITAGSANFFRKRKRKVWNHDEWQFFIEDLKSHLQHGGRIDLKLNKCQQGDYIHYQDPSFVRHVQKLGAKVSARGVLSYLAS